DYTRQSFVARYNADLANDFGNLVQRATTLASRHASLLADAPGNDQLCAPEIALQSEADALHGRVAVAFGRLALHEAAAMIGNFVKQANRYLEATAPWLLARNGDSERLGVVLRHAVHAARLAAAEYEPFIPRAAQEAERRLSASPPCLGAPLFTMYSFLPVSRSTRISRRCNSL